MSTTTSNNLPSDLEAAHQLIQQLQQSHQQLQKDLDKERTTRKQTEEEKAQLLHRLHLLLRHQYGRRSERFIDPKQLALFDQVFEALVSKAPSLQSSESSDSKSKKPRRGRRPLPAHLPRMRVEHELDKDERACPCCGACRVAPARPLPARADGAARDPRAC